MKENNYRKGFTLIELMIVVTIITILLGIVIASTQKQKSNARDRVRAADINTIRLAIEEYKLHCGEYPNKIELSTNNGHCNGLTLKDFLSNIPVAPLNSKSILTGDGGKYHNSEIDGSGYLYAGLSTTGTGKCYDYHIAAELERKSSLLSKDHDFNKNSGKYNTICNGSKADFGRSSDESDGSLLYDFRSSSSNVGVNEPK